MRCSHLLRLLSLCLLSFRAGAALPEFDLRQAQAAGEWRAAHHIAGTRPTADGLEISISGEDPYLYGPARDYPTNQPLWMWIRLKADQEGMAQVFFFDKTPAEEQSRRFFVPANEWVETRLSLPSLGTRFHLRVDPPGQSGKVVLAGIRFAERAEFQFPSVAWTRAVPGTRRACASGPLELYTQSAQPWGYEVRVNQQSMAFAHARLRVGYLRGKDPAWLELPMAAETRSAGAQHTMRCQVTDPEGAVWRYEQVLRAGPAGTLEVTTRVEVSQDREVLYLPMLLLAAGEQSFGTNKHQGLLAGLEYLENEPSSSEADIEGAESRRQVPASYKITFPLMVIQASNHYLGLSWSNHLQFSAVFDSPDRLFGSGGHALGILWPGSDGQNRVEGSLLPVAPQTLKAGQPLVFHGQILGGRGDTVIPAVQDYVRAHGLPPLPRNFSVPDYVSLAAHGWLHSKIRDGNLYRHAFWPGFNPQPAADAAAYQRWLADHAAQPGLSNELCQAAAEALALVPPAQYYHSGVGHVRTPAVPLAMGRVREGVASARATAAGALRRLGTNGMAVYRAPAGKTDYGRTHWADHANGLTAQVLASLLEAAAFCGDSNLTASALACLRQQDRYRGTVPRGAQTWEIPLHTPDILASAYLANAYLTGYELTGDPDWKEQAIYWAWTGVPFVYLENPTGKPIGPYSTIAVLGATGWKAPVWFGQPVQWCGLVYGHALYRLAEVDPRGPWRTLADGITDAGLQHTWKAAQPDKAGLLPDFFLLQLQRSDGPAINPGTVGINAIRRFGYPPLYEFRRLRLAGCNLHAPGRISPLRESARSASFQVDPALTGEYGILISGMGKPVRVTIDGKQADLNRPHEYAPAEGWLALKARGKIQVQLDFP